LLGTALDVVGTIEPVVIVGGDTTMVGTAAAELTPRFPISVEPRGIPVRLPLPGVDAGADEAERLLALEPHIPEIPDVSIICEVADIPEELGVAPVSDAVSVGPPPTDIPPPS
jgi:hypothetical protein